MECTTRFLKVPDCPGLFTFIQIFYMRFLLCFPLLFTGAVLFAQSPVFPDDWTGNWKGELHWYKAGQTVPQKVPMELRIQKTDSTFWTWHLIYGTPREDSRPYILKPVDRSKGHWVVDEKNGILLDQFWLGNSLTGAFTVSGSTILNTYRMENNELVIDFFSLAAKPLATTGKGDEEIPFVDSYRVTGKQTARLLRQ